jgi:hypothetical protein
VHFLRLFVGVSVASASIGCPPPAVSAQEAAPVALQSPLAPLERRFLSLRRIADQIDVTRSAVRTTSPRGVPLPDLTAAYDSARATLTAALARAGEASLGPADRRALSTMRKGTAAGLTFTTPTASGAPAAPDCSYDPDAVASGPDRFGALRSRIMSCYERAVRSVRVGDSTFDRLTVLARLGDEPSAVRRRDFFLALDTVWRSMNGDDGPHSPWRTLLQLSAARWNAGRSAVDAAARRLGVPPSRAEEWLVRVLDAWRAATPPIPLEPWDFFYETGAASRRLRAAIPKERLQDLTERYFASLGASPRRLNVQYDVEPRAGKTPVAYTTFGDRPAWDGTRWSPGEPWVFATYRDGGLGNLNEIVHETGHAVHIAAIHTRPAFADWPDSDPWTEALADLLALDVYEPAWQQRWLGDSVPLAEGLRARYAGIVMDVAWSLFEIRMHADPARDPNAVWADITSRYLHIVPHRELSWWAMRGQLTDGPGYMFNYALGAMIIADVRAAMHRQRGDWLGGDPGWYRHATDRLYRFGAEVPARAVVTRYLGRPFGPEALLVDLARMSAAARPQAGVR